MRLLLVLLVIASSDAGGQTPHKMSVEDAIAIGLENNRSVKISESRLSGERASSSERDAHMYPSLTLAGGYTRIEDGPFRLSTTNLPQPISVGSVVTNNYALRLGLRQPLFTGFRLSNAAEAAEAHVVAAEYDHAMTNENVVFQIESAYWSLYQARENHSFTVENIERLASYLHDTRKLMLAGMATINDSLKVEVELSNARLAEIEAGNSADLAEIRLNTIIGLSPATPLSLVSIPNQDTLSLGDLGVAVVPADTLVERAYDGRGDLLAAASRVRAATAAVGIEEGGWWPQIDLSANYLYNNPNSRYQPITPEFLASWDVGVSFVFEFWNWGATASKVERAEAQFREASLRELQLRDEIALDIHRAVLDVRKSKRKLAVAHLATNQAAVNRETLARKYNVGLTTATEVLEAEVSLLYVQTQRSGAEVELAIAQAALRRALGGTRSFASHE